MLVISNGAFKSGSTWLFMVLRCMTSFPPPPKEYWDPRWDDEVVYSINPRKLVSFLRDVDYSSRSYLSKNHLGRRRHRHVLLSCENVFVLDIERDIRDVVVSAYYHVRKLKGYDANFETFYWERGRQVARRVMQHHSLWRVDSPKVYISSYEKLKLDFNSEVSRLGEFLGFDLSERQIEAIREQTTLERLKEGSGEWNARTGRFRKGIIGDWQGHFKPDMLEDIEKIEKEMASPFRRTVADLASVPRRLFRKGRRWFLGL
jgi:hypothetical protein